MTNAPKENITTSSDVEIKLGSWDNGKLLISEHTGVFVPESAATCTQNGTKSHYKCNDCGNLFEDEDCTVLIKDPSVLTIPATGHTPGSEWYTTDTEHYQICDICKEEINKADHVSTGDNAATCQHKAVCDICGAEYGDLADHTWTLATCATPKTCSVCGATVGSALGHTGGLGWKSDGDNHWHVCTGCGVVIENSKAAHDFKWVIDKAATATESGSKHEECTICGYRKAPVEISVTGTPAEPGKNDGATSSPQTGDNSNMMLWITLLFVSGTGLFGATAYNRKKKYNQ